MKKLNLFIIALFVFCVCTPAFAASLNGLYMWEHSGQFSNGTLNITQLDGTSVLFSIQTSRGSESSDSSDSYSAAGVFCVDAGKGICEVDDGRYKGSVTFVFSGNYIKVFAKGNFPVDMDGKYIFSGSSFDFSEKAAAAFLESLPSSATSLNIFNRDYKIILADDRVKNGRFYSAKAMHVETNKVFADFLIASDLSCAYRIVDGKNVLIYGVPSK